MWPERRVWTEGVLIRPAVSSSPPAMNSGVSAQRSLMWIHKRKKVNSVSVALKTNKETKSSTGEGSHSSAARWSLGPAAAQILGSHHQRNFSFLSPLLENQVPLFDIVAFITVITFLQPNSLFVWNQKAWDEEWPAFQGSHLQPKQDRSHEDKTNPKQHEAVGFDHFRDQCSLPFFFSFPSKHHFRWLLW